MPTADDETRATSRVIILTVRPEVDGGRYPVKRVVGDLVEIEAEIVADGHDIVRGMLLHRAPGDSAWHEIELVATGNDVWRARFTTSALGRHHYTVTAWVDAFASWR